MLVGQFKRQSFTPLGSIGCGGRVLWLPLTSYVWTALAKFSRKLKLTAVAAKSNVLFSLLFMDSIIKKRHAIFALFTLPFEKRHSKLIKFLKFITVNCLKF